jgi:exopolyphosphatase/guanosine-5'-triphosphate,3'-diphosphate pyrophosphatase
VSFRLRRSDDPPSRLALIDLGSNTALMSVLFGDSLDPRRLRIAEELQIMTGLGRNKGPKGELCPEAQNRVLRALGHFAGRLDAMAVPSEAVLGATTAAMREAPDGRQFLEKIRYETGLELTVISGEQEAEYVASAQERSFPSSLPILMIDIGGGSTEVAWRERGRTAWKTSTPIGSVKLSEAHGNDLNSLLQTARDRVSTLPPAGGSPTTIGVAGTVTTCYQIAIKQALWDPSEIHGKHLTRATVLDLAEQLSTLSSKELRAVPGLPPGRADYIVGGLAILVAVMERYGAKELTVSDRGVRYGLLWERWPFAVIDDNKQATS